MTLAQTAEMTELMHQIDLRASMALLIAVISAVLGAMGILGIWLSQRRKKDFDRREKLELLYDSAAHLETLTSAFSDKYRTHTQVAADDRPEMAKLAKEIKIKTQKCFLIATLYFDELIEPVDKLSSHCIDITDLVAVSQNIRQEIGDKKIVLEFLATQCKAQVLNLSQNLTD